MAQMVAQLENMLATIDQVDVMLAEYERTGDKRIQATITKEMKGLTPILKVLLSNPECKTKENLHLLMEVSNRAKEMVEKTKKFPATRGTLGHADSQSVPATGSPCLASLQKETRSTLNLMGYLRKQGDKGPVKAWKKRWFQQRDTKLLYFGSENEMSPRGLIDLQQVESIENREGLDLTVLIYWVDGLHEYLASLRGKITANSQTTAAGLRVRSAPNSPARKSSNSRLEEAMEHSNPTHLPFQGDMIETYRKGMGAMEQRITELEEKLQHSNENLRIQLAHIENIERQNVEITGMLEQQQQELDTLRSASSFKLQEELHHKERELDQLRSFNIHLNEANQLLEAKNKCTNEVLESLRLEMLSKEKIILDFSNQLSDHTGAHTHAAPSSSSRTEADKLREAIQAHQTQNRFLCAEIQRLELEVHMLSKAKEEAISVWQHALAEARAQFQSLRAIIVGSSSSDTYQTKQRF